MEAPVITARLLLGALCLCWAALQLTSMPQCPGHHQHPASSWCSFASQTETWGLGLPSPSGFSSVQRNNLSAGSLASLKPATKLSYIGDFFTARLQIVLPA